MSCNFEQIEQMDERALDTLILRVLHNDTGAAAKSHLLAGRPVYYCDDDFVDEIIREWPDVIKELVTVSDLGDITAVACVIPCPFKGG